MSANNGYFVARFPDGYRVAYCQNHQNLDYYPEGSAQRKEMLRQVFGASEIFSDFELAMAVGKDLAKRSVLFLEFGVCYVGEYESFYDNFGDSIR